MKLKKHNKTDEHPGTEFYLTIGQAFALCGLISFILTFFIIIMPQDYEKYNVPLFIGIAIAFSSTLLLLGATIIVLCKKSKKFQIWAEKELLSFGKHHIEKDMQTAKKRRNMALSLSIAVILLVGIAVWYHMPIDLMNLDHREVMEIVVFNGNTGKATHITDKEQIQHIVDHLNTVEVKRSKPSAGYTGYSFKLTIYLSDGNEADGWNNFIINSEDTIRKDPFFYSVIDGAVDYSYIEDIVE